MAGTTSLLASNPHLSDISDDCLYHIGLSSADDLKAMFGDVRFVCMGGSSHRMESFAHLVQQELHLPSPVGTTLRNISSTDRYALYKVGPVLSVSHGVGVPSISVVMHEVIKLLHHAQVKDVYFFRIGTSGGIGLTAGTVVVTKTAVDGLLRPCFEQAILGKLVQHPTELDEKLQEEIVTVCTGQFSFDIVSGNTLCALDFYEAQARLDGAFCDYDKEAKFKYLRDIRQEGVVNIEMESTCFASMCQRAGIRGAVVCVTLLDRLKGDQVSMNHEELADLESRPQRVVLKFIKKCLNIPSKDV